MSNIYDAIIVGGGPAGSVCGLQLARAGLRVLILEKEKHPRFHIGESLLPRCLPLIKELRLEDELKKLVHQPKFGAEFGFGNDAATLKFGFTQGLLPGSPTLNIERSIFDEMLLNAAKKAGAIVIEQCNVKKINRLENNAVEIEATHQQQTHIFSGRVLLDASGQNTLVARHLGIRQGFADPQLQKCAYFQHFKNVQRLPGELSGHPAIFMTEEGWFWLIGLNTETTSVGFVTRPDFVKSINVPADKILQWAIARCPVVRERMKNAVGETTNIVNADFSYLCNPAAGPGYFLLGDAARFLDPIFSTGVTLAMMSANYAAGLVIQSLNNSLSASTAQQKYIQYLTDSTAPFWGLIRNYYKHSFRELFMNGTGPMKVHSAVISTLAGQVFPKPVWALRWRLKMFHLFVWLQKYLPLVPHRKPFSLMTETAQPLHLIPEPQSEHPISDAELIATSEMH